MNGAQLNHQRQIVDEHLRAELAGDLSAVCATFVQSDKCHWDFMPAQRTFQGISGIHEFYASIFAAISGLNVEVKAEYDVPGCSIREAIISGKHVGEYFGLKPLRNRIRIEMAAFFIFDLESGRLLAERAYFDHETLLGQMRGDKVS